MTCGVIWYGSCKLLGMPPDMRPTVRVPPMPYLAPAEILANRLRRLAGDLQTGRLTDTDQIMIAAMLRTLDAANEAPCD